MLGVETWMRRRLDQAVEKHLSSVERSPALSRCLRQSLRRIYAARDAAEDQLHFVQLKSRNFMPNAIQIQISRACNLRCTMCGWAVWQRNRGFMKLDLYMRILDEMERNSIRKCWLTNPQGEPLLNPQAIKFVEIALVRGFEVIINTNCTTLSEKNVNGLVDQASSGRLEIQASFSGHDKESHEAVYVGSKFELSSAKLKALNDALSARGLERHLTVNGIVYDAAALKKSIAFLEQLGITRDRITMGLPDNFAGIVEVGRKNREKGFYSYKRNLPYRSFRLCSQFAWILLIYDDGKVSACPCRDSEGEMEIGDITKQSLLDIRTGQRFMQMMEAFMQRDLDRLPFCRKCDIPYGDRDNVKLFVSGSAVA